MTNNDTPEARVRHAAALVKDLLSLVLQEGPGNLHWYRMLLDIRDVLTDREIEPQAALQQAAEMFDHMYDGPRNFSEFYIQLSDPEERVTANTRLTEMVDAIRTALHNS